MPVGWKEAYLGAHMTLETWGLRGWYHHYIGWSVEEANDSEMSATNSHLLVTWGCQNSEPESQEQSGTGALVPDVAEDAAGEENCGGLYILDLLGEEVPREARCPCEETPES